MIAPTGIPSLPDAIRAGSEVYHTFRAILEQNSYSYAIGDEGGISTDFPGRDGFSSLSLALTTVIDAIGKSGYAPGKDIKLAIDFAAQNCIAGDTYKLVTQHDDYTAEKVTALCSTVARSFPVLMFEDPLGRSHVDSLRILHNELAGATLITADDLAREVPSTEQRGLWDAVLVMPDRIGTLAQAIQFVAEIRAANMTPIASHRSSETEDTFISDFAVALALPFIKAGGMSGSERTAKYNQLLRLAELHDNGRVLSQASSEER
jgi:enolase